MSKILLADDNPHAQRMGSQILSQEGHDVTTVSDGDEAMAHLAEHQPDLVMVDTRMPGPSGIEICRHLKNDPQTNAIKVVLLAGPLEPFDEGEASEAGSDGVLHKPLDAFTLIEKVNSLLLNGHPEDTHDGAAPAETSGAEAPAENFEPPEPFDLVEAAENTTAAPGQNDAAAEPIEIVAGSPQEEPGSEDEEPEPVLEIPMDGDAADVVNEATEQSDPPDGPETTPADPATAAIEIPAVVETVAVAVDGDLSDAFESVVADALWTDSDADLQRDAVREAVQEVLEAALPAIVERVTDKVVERLAPR